VGKDVYWDKSWVVFPDFLFSFMKRTLGPEWGAREKAKDQHPIFRWLGPLARISRGLRECHMEANESSTNELQEVTPSVDGRSWLSCSDKTLSRHNPADDRRLEDIPAGCSADVDRAVTAARKTFAAGAWHQLPPTQRKEVLYRWAGLIKRCAPHLDRIDAIEMGKPVSTLPFNSLAAAGLIRFSAESIDKCSGDVLSSDRLSMVIQTRVPRGMVGAIVPWNFPTYNSALKAAPALAAGNSVVLKPSELACESALTLAKLALEAGIPPGVFNVIPGSGEIVGKALAEHMDVDMVTFTGSSAVGKLIVLTPATTVYWQSRSYTDALNINYYAVNAYSKTDLTLTHMDPTGNWQVSGYVFNLENDAVRSGDYSGSGVVFSDFAPPRTYGVRLAYKY
jgi:Aldehyde dehydrogenase family